MIAVGLALPGCKGSAHVSRDSCNTPSTPSAERRWQDESSSKSAGSPPVQNCQSEVRGIGGRPWRKLEESNDVAFNGGQLRWEVQFRYALQVFQTTVSSPRITPACFIKREDRGVKAKSAALLPPPLMRELLIGGNGRMPAWAGRQVAGNRRLDVHRLHLLGGYASKPAGQAYSLDVSL